MLSKQDPSFDGFMWKLLKAVSVNVLFVFVQIDFQILRNIEDEIKFNLLQATSSLYKCCCGQCKDSDGYGFYLSLTYVSMKY